MAQDETHYTLNEPLTRDSLDDFIGNFSERNLMRIRRSSSGTTRAAAGACGRGRICVREIDADNFESVVLNNTSDVMVFYRKRNCVFCDVAGRFFLRVYHMFDKYLPLKASERTGTDLPLIQFVTIDGELNDLPWQYTVDKYPTIAFYPAFRYSLINVIVSHDCRLLLLKLWFRAILKDSCTLFEILWASLSPQIFTWHPEMSENLDTFPFF